MLGVARIKIFIGYQFGAITVLDPKRSCEVAGLLVVQFIVTDVLATTLVRPEITGGLSSSVDDGAEGGGGDGGKIE